MADSAGSTTRCGAMPLPDFEFLYLQLRLALFAILSEATATFFMNIADSGRFDGRPVLETYATRRMFVDAVVEAVSPRAVQRGTPTALEVDGAYVVRLAATAVYFYLWSRNEAQQVADTRTGKLEQVLGASFAEHPPRRRHAENDQELWFFMSNFAFLADCVCHTLDSGRDMSITRDALNLLLGKLLAFPLQPDKNGNPKRARGTSASGGAPRFVKLEVKIFRKLTGSAPIPRDTNGNSRRAVSVGNLANDAQLSDSDGQGATTDESNWSDGSWTSTAQPDVAPYNFGGEQLPMDIPQPFFGDGVFWGEQFGFPQADMQIMHLQQPFTHDPPIPPLFPYTDPAFYSTTGSNQVPNLDTYPNLNQDTDELPFSDEEWAALECFLSLSDFEAEQFLLDYDDL